MGDERYDLSPPRKERRFQSNANPTGSQAKKSVKVPPPILPPPLTPRTHPTPHYTTAFARFSLAQADNVGSNQMAKIRYALRGSATVLMGKNTMIRKIISIYCKDNPGHPLEMVRAFSQL